MKFLSPVVATLLAAASVNADFPTILNDGIKIIQDLNALQTQLSAFTGAAADAQTIITSSTSLSNDLKATAGAVADTPTLAPSEGNLLANTIAGLQDPIFKVVDLYQARAQQFKVAVGGKPAGAAILTQLTSIKNNTDAFAANLSPKLPANLQKVAPLLASNIAFHYIRAIQLYQKLY